MMYLPALSIGYAIPREDFDASVHSVFHSALNLGVDRVTGLLTLLAAGEADLPQGIRLDTPAGFSFENLQAGESAACRDGLLIFKKSSLTVQLSRARRWKCDLSTLMFDPAKPAVAGAWRFVWDALDRRQRMSEAEIIAGELLRSDESARGGVSRKAGEAMQQLIEATRRNELTDRSAVHSLIGLGPGLTPSGDDLLVGYLTGLGCTKRERSEREQFVSSLSQAILNLLSQTTDISRTYLYHAARGQIASRLADLAEAICGGEEPTHLRETAEAAMSTGHTSGMDVVTGLLMGLAAWEDPGLFK